MKRLRITVGKKTYDVTVEVLGDDGHEPADGRSAGAAAPSRPAAATPTARPAPQAPQGPVQDGAVLSPLAGVIVSLLVNEGDEVRKGQDLLILEAMKMENRITAPRDATVRTINVAQGDSVIEGHVLLVLE